MTLNVEWIGIFFFFIVLVSIQYSLNKIIVLLKEIKHLLEHKK
ncbi:hypothetical protein ACR6HW_15720 [Fusibacter sp. JL298sf-3]